jgi:uncharacterized protein with HEPN domain
MKEDKLYLLHIQECLARIQSYVSTDKQTFMTSNLIQDAVLRNLQIMAESTQRLSPEIKTQHPELPWRDLSGFRNVLAHNYLGISLERIWEVIDVELPELTLKFKKILEELQ